MKYFALRYNKPQVLSIICLYRSFIDNILIQEFNELRSVYNPATEAEQLCVAVTVYACVWEMPHRISAKTPGIPNEVFQDFP
jgi:hypothetical protein